MSNRYFGGDICYKNKYDLEVASYIDAFDRSVIVQKTLIVPKGSEFYPCVHLIVIAKSLHTTSANNFVISQCKHHYNYDIFKFRIACSNKITVAIICFS